MGTRRRTSKQKKCQFHVAVQTLTMKSRLSMYHICDKKIDNQWHGYDVCDWHRRFLQDHDIEKLKEYQRWEEEFQLEQIKELI